MVGYILTIKGNKFKQPSFKTGIFARLSTVLFSQEIMRREWMFKLVGREHFTLGKTKTKCVITIDAVSGFSYEYTLEVNGKSLEKFSENQSKVMVAWELMVDGVQTRVALGKLKWKNIFLQSVVQ